MQGFMLRSAVTVLGAFQLVALAGCQGGSESITGGRTRTYYLAADELEWTYVPSRGDQAITGKRDDFANDPASAGMLDPNQSTYRKAVFREYADASFRTLKPRTDQWMHLGILGPVLRAQVGDTIRVVFRNNATRPYSLHPHGVLYPKSAEGFAYLDSTLSRARLDDSIPAGGTYTYVWPVPERAGPSEGEGSSAFWLYHSHVDEGRDINAGLIGPIIITRRGMARTDGSPVDVDREFVIDFGLFDEPLSWYWGANVARIYGNPKKYHGGDLRMADVRTHEFHHFYTINGFIEGNGSMMTMRQGDRVRWYVFANPNEEHAWDNHTLHWHGQTAVANQQRTDMLMLTPMMTVVADMQPDNPGIWLLHCHMPGHFRAGMYTRFTVLPQN
jgi:FtsP/CotA-like multicopper oxidase with cupredoxin domain